MQSWRNRDGRSRDTSASRISTQKATSDVAAEFDFSAVPEAPQTFPTFPTLRRPPPIHPQHPRPYRVPNSYSGPLSETPLRYSVGRFAPTILPCVRDGSGNCSPTSSRYCTIPKRPEHLERTATVHALVLAPTHEMARQLAGFGKVLVRHGRLRVQSASRANVASGSKARVPAAKMAKTFTCEDADGEFEVHPGAEQAML
jgi:hypothetical protein